MGAILLPLALLPGGPLVAGTFILTGLSSFITLAAIKDSRVKQLANDLKYNSHGNKVSTLRINQDIKVAQRENRTVDVIISPKVSYSVSEYKNDERTQILFQDMCIFGMSPSTTKRGYKGADNYVDSEHWMLNTRGVAPENSNKEINYKSVHTWTAKAGINVNAKGTASEKSGIEAGTAGSGEMSYTATTETSRVIKEFELQYKSSFPPKGASWQMLMQLDAGGAPYDVKEPATISTNNKLTKWFKDAPSIATGDLSLPFLVSFQSIDEEALRKGTARFDFGVIQRLIYGEVAGRFGLPGARLGGTAVLVPFYVVLVGTLVIDFDKRDARIENTEKRTLTFSEVINKAGVCLRSSDGLYVCADRDSNRLVANRQVAAEWETFRLIPKEGAGFTMLSSRDRPVADNTYMMRDTSEDNFTPLEFETIEPNARRGEKIFKVYGQNKYLTVARRDGQHNPVKLTEDIKKAEPFEVSDMIPGFGFIA
jgi:hypothetical protein